MVRLLASLAVNHYLILTFIGSSGATAGFAALYLFLTKRDERERKAGLYIGYCGAVLMLIATIPFYCANLAYLHAVSQHPY